MAEKKNEKKTEATAEVKSTAKKFERIAALTLPMIVIDPLTTKNIKIMSEPFLGRPDPEGKKETPMIVHAIDLDAGTGEMGEFLLPSMLKSKFKETYTDKEVPLKGKAFEITDGGKIKGKKGNEYRKFTVYEIKA